VISAAISTAARSGETGKGHEPNTGKRSTNDTAAP
jgi:hypothetical protein